MAAGRAFRPLLGPLQQHAPTKNTDAPHQQHNKITTQKGKRIDLSVAARAYHRAFSGSASPVDAAELLQLAHALFTAAPPVVERELKAALAQLVEALEAQRRAPTFAYDARVRRINYGAPSGGAFSLAGSRGGKSGTRRGVDNAEGARRRRGNVTTMKAAPLTSPPPPSPPPPRPPPTHRYPSKGGCRYFDPLTPAAVRAAASDARAAVALHRAMFGDPSEFSVVLTGNLPLEAVSARLLRAAVHWGCFRLEPAARSGCAQCAGTGVVSCSCTSASAPP